MDTKKVSEIVAEAAARLHSEADCSSTHTYTLKVPGSDHPVHVVMFSDNPEACGQALETIRLASK